MISKKSSRNEFGFTFRRTLSKNWFFSVIYALLTLLSMLGVWAEISSYRYVLRHTGTQAAEYLRNSFRYIFTVSGELSTVEGGESAMTDIFTRALVGFAIVSVSAVLAFFIFSFVMNKKTTNVYFSLGISRTGLFVSKYLAGITVITAGIAVPFIATFIANLAFYGFCRELVYAAVYMIIKYLVSAYLSFTVFVIAQTVLGSIIEAVVMGGVCLASPGIISSAFSMFMSGVVYGSPYSNVYKMLFFRQYGTLKEIDAQINVFDYSKYLLPLSSDSEISAISYMAKGEIADYGRLFSMRNFISPAVSVAAVAALAVIACFLFRNRKTEKAGFMGTNVLIEGYCVVVVGTFLALLFNTAFFAGGAELSFRTTQIITFIAGIIIMTVGYSVVDFICVRSLKAYAGRIKNLAIELGIFTVIFLIFAVGVSGAYRRIPSADKVKSANITVYDELGQLREYASGTFIGTAMDEELRLDASLMEKSIYGSVMEGFDSKEDIEKIAAANREANSLYASPVCLDYSVELSEEQAVPYNLRIEYVLKNGKKCARMYSVANMKAIKAVGELAQTDHFIDAYLSNITEGGTLHNEIVKQEKYKVRLVSPNLSGVTMPEDCQTAGFKTQLLEALALDIKERNLPLNYNSDAELAGYIIIQEFDKLESYGIDVEEGGQTVFYNENVTCPLIIPVNVNMKNILALFEKSGLSEYFENTAEPEQIIYCKYRQGDTFYSRNTEDRYMTSGILPRDLGEWAVHMPDYSVTVTDPGEISAVEKTVRLKYPVNSSGYFVQLKYSDGTSAFGFIPDELFSGK